jgi:hypothetical protein
MTTKPKAETGENQKLKELEKRFKELEDKPGRKIKKVEVRWERDR